VEYSHSNLSPEAQKLLICLAPFSGFVFRGNMPDYIKELEKLEAFQDYQFAKFDAAIQEAINWGLLSPHLHLPGLLTIQPILPYFLKSKLNIVDEKIRYSLCEGFKNYYQNLAENYEKFLSCHNAQEQELARFFCKIEYENLYNALEICLKNKESISIFFCLDKYLNIINDNQNNLKLADKVFQCLNKYPSEFIETELGYQISMALDRLARCYLQTKQYQQARLAYQQKLDIFPRLSYLDQRTKQLAIAGIYHNLGSVSHGLRDFAKARDYYQKALAIKIEYSDRNSQAGTYHQLGYVYQELRDFAEARRNYKIALEIFDEFGDRNSQADTYHNLGNIAYLLEEFPKAKDYYQQALYIYIEFNNRYEQAGTYHQLGNIAYLLGELLQARCNYQKALEVFIEYKDSSGQRKIYHEFGRLSEELGEYKEARGYYEKALVITIKDEDRYSLALTYQCLAILAEAQEDYAEARTNLQKALEIYVEYKDEYRANIIREILEGLPE
jgi:tetratricopeptide (TPR) repeat protein